MKGTYTKFHYPYQYPGIKYKRYHKLKGKQNETESVQLVFFCSKNTTKSNVSKVVITPETIIIVPMCVCVCVYIYIHTYIYICLSRFLFCFSAFHTFPVNIFLS